MKRLCQSKAAWLKEMSVGLALFCLALVPRVWNLSAFMTPDGRRWLDRSADLLIGLMKRDWELTYSAGNPALILTKWFGLMGILVRYGLHRLGWRAWHDPALAASASLEAFLQAIKAQPDNPLDGVFVNTGMQIIRRWSSSPTPGTWRFSPETRCH